MAKERERKKEIMVITKGDFLGGRNPYVSYMVAEEAESKRLFEFRSKKRNKETVLWFF